MAAFPTFALGETAHLPFSQITEYMNATNRMPHGWQYAYNLRSNPLHRWSIAFSLTDADLITLQNFWDARKGAYEEFSFTDPESGLTYTKCRFSGDSLSVRSMGPNEHLVTVEIHEYA
jgi:phage-related protein